MIKLTFSDGITIDTSGPYRTIWINRELFVIGQGNCVPVKDGKEAAYIIKLFKENK